MRGRPCVVLGATWCWVIRELGAKAIVSAGYGIRDVARTAIQDLSDPVQAFGTRTLGWHEVAGRWLFVDSLGVVNDEEFQSESGPTVGSGVTPFSAKGSSENNHSGPIEDDQGPIGEIYPVIDATFEKYVLPRDFDPEELKGAVRTSLNLLVQLPLRVV